jgi:pimeloyl-ACP methyl ester carboxylesterase/DNA-binding SARP family transcriptional activator
VASGPICYARNGGVSLAFCQWGAGPATIVAIPPMAQNIELAWELAQYRYLFGRLGSFARFVHFDKRGTGLSDRSVGVPTLDERVEDTRAVMDAAGVDRTVLLGVSEGGPMAALFAATYPDRVSGLVMLVTAARFRPDDETEQQRTQRLDARRPFIDSWGTDRSLTLKLHAPSVADDPVYREWQPRYERQSASPVALAELIAMLDDIDVRPILPRVAVPTLVLHRRDDPVIPIARAREVADLIPHARFVELSGSDHWGHVGDVDSWIDEVERFTTGRLPSRPPASRRPTTRPAITVIGGFTVRVDDADVATSAWGSRRARQLCKRLAVALGRPITRDELAETLWPDGDVGRLSSRLSVQLSAVRRILGGGVIADRNTVRLDLDNVDVDLAEIYDALAAGDDQRAVDTCPGELLPDDLYDDWTIAPRMRLRESITGARRRLATTAAHDPASSINHLTHLLDLDPYDEWAHEQLANTLTTCGRHGEARQAELRYRNAMDELGIRPRSLTSAPNTPPDQSLPAAAPNRRRGKIRRGTPHRQASLATADNNRWGAAGSVRSSV